MALIDLNKLNKNYLVHVSCTNCGQIQELKIPKGEKKEQYLQKGKCENCGCYEVLILRADEIKKELEENERKRKEDEREKQKQRNPKLLWK